MYIIVSDHDKLPHNLHIPKVNIASRICITKIPLNILSNPSFPLKFCLIKELKGDKSLETLILHSPKIIPKIKKNKLQFIEFKRLGISDTGEIYDASGF